MYGVSLFIVSFDPLRYSGSSDTAVLVAIITVVSTLLVIAVAVIVLFVLCRRRYESIDICSSSATSFPGSPRFVWREEEKTLGTRLALLDLIDIKCH